MNTQTNKQKDETLFDDNSQQVNHSDNETTGTPKEKDGAGKQFASAAGGAVVGSIAGSASARAANTYAAPAEEEEIAEEDADMIEEEAQPLSNHTVDAPIHVSAAGNVSDEMSFNEAFAAARRELGAGGVFYWRGNAYNTYYREEWAAMSHEQKTDFANAIPAAPATGNQSNTHFAAQETTQVDLAAPIHDVEVLQVEIEGQVVDFMPLDIDGDGAADVVFIDVDRDGNIDYILEESGEMHDVRPPTFEDVAQIQQELNELNELTAGNLPNHSSTGADDNLVLF